MKLFSIFKRVKQQKEPGVSYDIILGNAISMEAFYEKGKVKITNLSQTIKTVTGSDIVYG